MTDSQATRVTTDLAARELVMTRVFDAPRALVWKAYTEPERLARWWGPNGWTLPACTLDLRPGGVWHYCMRGPNGEESWGRAVYREIVAPERLVYVDSFADAAGHPVAGMPEMLITVTFEDLEGKTKITSRTRFASAADLESVLAMGVVEGMTQTWDRLEALLRADPVTGTGGRDNHKLMVTLPSDREIAMERTFDAPRRLVFEAFTKPEHLRNWWGLFEGSTMTVCEIDARPGGAWRMVVRGADGNENGFRGEFREVVAPERLTWTFEWEGLPGHISVETVEFDEREGQTTMRAVARFDSVEDRDGMLQSGMEAGASASYAHLDAYLETLK